MAGYVYKGSEFDAKPRTRPKPVGKPFDPALCGTAPGVWQHRRLGQPQCAECRANRRRGWREKKGSAG
jgi:hypothetical protein